jgi:hypothetical protein
MAIENAARPCSLEAAVGKTGACPEDRCPFWEPGGAALGARCAVEQLGVLGDPPLAAWLLEIREKLMAAGSEDERQVMRGVFHQLLNDSAE